LKLNDLSKELTEAPMALHLVTLEQPTLSQILAILIR
jgi:hypothetical protein